MTAVIAVTDDIPACLALRRVVFIDEQGVSEADEIDTLDGQSTHIIAKINSVPVGTARVTAAGEVAKIGRVCVLKPHRGAGLGADLIRAALDVARTWPQVRSARLGAQVHALGFYEGLGFTAFGPVYDDAGIPHRDMERAL